MNGLAPSDHAVRRWHARKEAPDDKTVMDAWRDGDTVRVGRTWDADEARWCHDADVLMLRKDVTIVSVIDPSWSERSIIARRLDVEREVVA